MNSVLKYSAFVAIALLILPYAAYADMVKKSQYASQVLQLQMTVMTFRDSYATGYLNDFVSAINNSTITSPLTSTYIPNIGNDYKLLQSDATANNAIQFKTDTKSFDADVKAANTDSHSEIKASHSKTVYSTLKSDLNQLKSTYNTCILGVKQQYAQLKVQMFSNALSHEQNRTNKLGSHGENTTALGQTINSASSEVKAFETAVNNAQNSTQLQAALNSFCLYNGCKNPDNFHFAAKTVIETDQSKLNVLATKNNTSSYQGLVSQAQTDLTNAQNTLSQVGSNQYKETQSSDVWNNIKAAADLIHHLQQIENHKH